MGIRKEPATVTRRLSESLGFALMPLGFKPSGCLRASGLYYARRRCDTFTGLTTAQPGRLAGSSSPLYSHLPGRSPGLCTDQRWRRRPS